MSIPGLGQIAPQPTTTSSNRTITLRPLGEWRFSVSRASSITCRLLSGTAERDGTELSLNQPYTFTRTKSKILTWTGCVLEVSGDFDSESTKNYDQPDQSPFVSYFNLHFALHQRRVTAATSSSQLPGPRVMICGGANTGKTSLAKMLVALSTRMGEQPLLVNVDPRDGMLSLPGTISAAVFATVMDVEDPSGGIGVTSTPSSGPSAVPVKLPMAYYYGRQRVGDDEGLWRSLVSKLGSSVRAKFGADDSVRSAGLVVDTPSPEAGGDVKKEEEGEEGGGVKREVDRLVHVVREFAVNIVVLLQSPELQAELEKRLAGEKTAHGEDITVLPLEKSDGVAERSSDFLKADREAAIKEYFFGDSKRTLSPFTQSVGFDDVAIFKAPDDFYDSSAALEPAEISQEMSHWTLAVMNASVNDPPETIRQAPVVGWVAIADVDEDRRRLKILSPVSGRLGNRPMVWGSWPEPYINLLG